MLPVLGSIGLLVLAGCGNGNDAETDTAAAAADSLDPEGMGAATRTDALKEIFHAAPSPMEIADMVKRAGASFDAKALNPSSNATKYTTSDRQAINLGVYGADLSYATMFEQNAASLEYLATVKQLSNSLGISDVLTDEVMAQANANRTDRDALIDLISSAFYDVNERLKENGTEDLAGLVVAAGWVEGMYLAKFLAAGGENVLILMGISCGSVMMGAMTYIGNGPNFMVKAIAEENGVKMPSFFGYMAWSMAILIPTFIAITYIFFV